MMNATSRLSLASLLAASVMAFAMPAGAEGADSAEIDTYRFGGTFARMEASSPAVCAALCTEDNRCEAWSHAPQMIDVEPQCELKRTQGRAENRPGYTSGIAGFHQVGALRDEVGTVVQPDRRNTGRAGMRSSIQAFPQGYSPVSEGIEVEELLGAGGAAKPTAQTRSVSSPKPETRNADPYAPMQVVLARPSAGKYGGTSDTTSYGTSYSSRSYPSRTTGSTVSPSYSSPSSGSGGQVIQARPSSSGPDPSFYEDDDS